eukprot:2488631-Pleurochrysis_carterae.AAC.6
MDKTSCADEREMKSPPLLPIHVSRECLGRPSFAAASKFIHGDTLSTPHFYVAPFSVGDNGPHSPFLH